MKPSPDGPAESPADHVDEHLDLSARNSRTGLWLFAVYLAAYVVFVVMAAYAPGTMGQPTPLGPNVAIVYGFGLIFGAVLLAMVYMFLCKRNADQFDREGGGR
ncbi:MAG: DUF485 domain-containing protein [Planctomycetales bacterium]|nr:DUF485 domain-containing protein [Planctomycetales bacterium]